jgi:hypothetical protein
MDNTMKMEKCAQEHEWSDPNKAWPDHRIRHCEKCGFSEVWFDKWSEEERKRAKVRLLSIGESE